MNSSLSYWKHRLLEDTSEETNLTDKQKQIAKLDPPVDKLDAGDFAALRAGKKADVEEHHNDPNFPGGPAIHDLLDRISNDFGTDSDLYNQLEDTIIGYADKYGNLSSTGKAEIKKLLANYDVLEDYGWILDPKPADHTGETTSGMNEDTQDHEVSMADNSLSDIIKNAQELLQKIGGEEKNIPAWIQDHITNAQNFISQANTNYHDYEYQDTDSMSLSDIMEDLFEIKKYKKSK
jgi:hypothetical protein